MESLRKGDKQNELLKGNWWFTREKKILIKISSENRKGKETSD